MGWVRALTGSFHKHQDYFVNFFSWPAHYLTALALFVSVTLFAPAVFGHGGVSVEDDVCIIKIDRYKAHFTGYLPKQRATQEFCEDIPLVAESIFVIDFISDELRNMELDFRIVRDVNSIGVTATYADLGGPEAIEKATIYYQEPRQFQKGVMNVRYNFVQEGGYIGIVNAHHLETGLKYTSVFPFAVGSPQYGKYVKYFVLLFLLCAIFIYGAGRSHIFRPK